MEIIRNVTVITVLLIRLKKFIGILSSIRAVVWNGCGTGLAKTHFISCPRKLELLSQLSELAVDCHYFTYCTKPPRGVDIKAR